MRPLRRLRPRASLARWLAVAFLAVGAVVLTAAPAAAHALRVASDPAPGADLPAAPPVVTVTFGEQPDPNLSSLRILNSSGQNVAKGKTTVVPGHPLMLEIGLGQLGKGVYTVAWTTVSKVDGHLASGTFAFGVGVAPTAAASAATVGSAGPSNASTAGRWLFYIGVMVLAGGAVAGLVCFGAPPPHWRLITLAAFVLGAAGAVLLAVSGATAAHVTAHAFLGSTFGTQLLRRVTPLAVVALTFLVPARLWRNPFAVLPAAIGGLAAMWGDVMSSHAAAATHYRLLRMGDQWLHFASAGVWLGGLGVTLLGVAVLANDERSRVVRRYSRLALGAVAVLAASGLQRGLDEVGSWHALRATTFGHYIVVKSVLFAVLIGLAAVNRFRSVPAVARALRPLRAVGSAELGIGAVVLVASALIQGLAPPASVAAGAPKPIVLSASDYATTVKTRLDILPGTAGFNSFTLRIDSYDTGRPISASVSLTFALPARPDLGTSTLTLARGANGVYTGQGANLSINGTWTITALIQTGTSGVTTTYTATTRQAPEQITVERNKGLPNVYTISLPGGASSVAGSDSLQIYLDPGHPGFNEFHATYVGADGDELPMRSLTVTATPPSHQPQQNLTVRKLDTIGHYVADLPGAVKGPYAFRLLGTATDGTTFDSTITIPVS